MTGPHGPIGQVAPADLADWIAANSGAQAPLLLDVREPAECAAASIAPPGVELLQWPMRTIPERLAELDRARPIAVLCHSGERSLYVARFLMSNGFERVVNVAGGIDAWSLEVDPDVPRY